ncbi:UDP-N-acetylglucosamine 2-epimerase [Candidatus Pelagibacter sp.]|uniref:UDP-N-acetylglucosamine 2-epimerase n=1 Tax=Candidatus Pelagibacter sp. TaxID=2024849 RepID=UPI003F8416F4
MKILFLTGSRSDWGYIKPIIEITKKLKINHKLCVTNMLLLDSFGYGINDIKREGFVVHEEIYMSLDGFNEYTTVKSMGIFLISFTDIIKSYKPDWVILAGDRYETMAAAMACAYTNTPIAHIQAGEVSGNIDGQARHAIGKFAHLHLASNEDAKRRLVRLGEEKFRIKVVGAPQLDDIEKLKKKKLNFSLIRSNYNIPPKKKYFLVVFHSVTEDIKNVKKNFICLFNSLNKNKLKKLWILPNNDPGSSIIKNMLISKRNEDNLIYENFPRHHYLEILSNAFCIIGNSSSGIIESSSYKIPSINLGRRQKNRLKPKNVIDIPIFSENKILKAISKIKTKKFQKQISMINNPYGDGKSSAKIIKILKSIKNEKNLMMKEMTY